LSLFILVVFDRVVDLGAITQQAHRHEADREASDAIQGDRGRGVVGAEKVGGDERCRPAGDRGELKAQAGPRVPEPPGEG
jgi:hypothetical protein